MKRLRPGTTILGGTALGLIAGAAVYGAIASASVATSAPVSYKPSQVHVALAPPPAAPCAAGQTLEKGVCIVHVTKIIKVKRVVVRPAPAVIQAFAPNRPQAQLAYHYRTPRYTRYRPTRRYAAEPGQGTGGDD